MTPRIPGRCSQAEPCVTRRKVTLGVVAVVCAWYLAGLALSWWLSPSAREVQAGEQLFKHEWQPNDPQSASGDGLGPVFNAKSCVACHFQGGTGGAGGLVQNVAAFEVLPTRDRLDPTGGVVHAFATQTLWQESRETVRKAFPIVPKGVIVNEMCKTPLVQDFDPVIHHSINTPTLFGAGKIDRISGLSIRAQHAGRMVASVERDLALDFNRSGLGRVRVLPDGRIGKFGWKAQFATLDEFVANACAVEIGLSTPTRKQHLPQAHHEDPTAKPDLNRQQFRQLVAYVASLPEPQFVLPQESVRRSSVERGQMLFGQIGCADCHTPDLGGAKRVYSDFCLHDITDPDQGGSDYGVIIPVPLPADYPRATEWKTPPLWGVGQTAPYLHDGSALTLFDSVQQHGGEARHVRKKFQELPEADRAALIQFLESLVVPIESSATRSSSS